MHEPAVPPSDHHDADPGFAPRDSHDPHDPHDQKSAPGRSGATITIAWLVIAVVVTLIIFGNQSDPEETAEGREASEQVLVVMTEMQGRYLYGASQILPSGSEAAFLANAKELFGRGSLGQRMRLAVLAAALAGPESGREEIARLWSDIEEETIRRRGHDRPFELSAADEETIRDLEALFRTAAEDGEPSEQAIDDARSRVRAELGWFGMLAASLGDDGDADAAAGAKSRAVRTFVVAIIAIGSAIALCFVGAILLVFMLVLAYDRRTRLRLPSPGAAPHGIYAETFACWMVLFVLCMGPGASVLAGAGVPGLTAATIAFFLSLAALVWPVLRGVPWQQVRADIGLTRGASLPAEVGAGIAGYVMGLPFLVVGAAITFVLMFVSGAMGGPVDETAVRTLFPTDTGPAHPIVGQMADANIFTYLQLLLVASVAAPVVEEIMFRGVLYRHLRDASGGLTRSVSIPFSVFFSAFIFAAVHPQGWMGVPALMGLAIAFALAREWRSSLIAPIVMHGVSNGLVMTMLALLVAG